MVEVSTAEWNLIRRLRRLTTGRHLLTIDKSRAGVDALSVMGSGNVEHLEQLPLPAPEAGAEC